MVFRFPARAKKEQIGGERGMRSSSTDHKRSSTLQAEFEISYRSVEKLKRKNKGKNGHTPTNCSQFGYWNEGNIDGNKKFDNI